MRRNNGRGLEQRDEDSGRKQWELKVEIPAMVVAVMDGDGERQIAGRLPYLSWIGL